LSVMLAFFAGSVLLHPRPAGASGGNARQFVFGPVDAVLLQHLFLHYFNSGSRPTPVASVQFLHPTGAVLSSDSLQSAPPGFTRSAFYALTEGGPVTVTVTFHPPAMGQAIPSPFPGTLSIWNGSETLAVVGPAR